MRCHRIQNGTSMKPLAESGKPIFSLADGNYVENTAYAVANAILFKTYETHPTLNNMDLVEKDDLVNNVVEEVLKVCGAMGVGQLLNSMS